MSEKVVLAYSGGLDTTALIPWLKENFGYEIICVCINCGQEEELTDDNLQERALSSGASKLYIEDVVDEFADEYIMPCVQAGAVYEHQYLLGTSMARPLIAKRLVEGGADVIGLRFAEMTLEEIFLDLIAKEDNK